MYQKLKGLHVSKVLSNGTVILQDSTQLVPMECFEAIQHIAFKLSKAKTLSSFLMAIGTYNRVVSNNPRVHKSVFTAKDNLVCILHNIEKFIIKFSPEVVHVSVEKNTICILSKSPLHDIFKQ